MYASEGNNAACSLIARAGEHARKLAMLRAVSFNPDGEIDTSCIDWATDLVSLLIKRMLAAVDENCHANGFERNVRKVLSIIQERGEATQTELTRQAQSIPPRDMKEIIAHLENADYIKTVTINSETGAGRPKTIYQLIEDGN